MTANELRQKFLDFFKEKGHAIIASASLIPENDPTTLFTGSGMQPMIFYLLGAKHPLGKRIVDSQKCFRAQDIEEVGDNRHTTLFEMLGNWSLGDYFKKEQILWMFEFLTKEIGLNPEKIYITVFRGSEKLNIPRDTEAVDFWKKEFAKRGIEARDVDFAERDGMQGGRIFYYEEKKNWWSRVGVPADMPQGEPGGPDSEMFWDFGADLKIHENSKFKDQPCHVNCDCGRFLEIGNNVFMQYIKTDKGFELLPKGNIDFGGGLERLTAASNDDPDIFKTDLFDLIIKKIEEISGKGYEGERFSTPLRFAKGFDEASQPPLKIRGGEMQIPPNPLLQKGGGVQRAMRVIADHIKAATFILAEGLEPSNTERGYVLRRLIRRAIRYGKQLGVKDIFTFKVANVVVEMYRDVYPELHENRAFIEEQLVREEEKFTKTLEKGLREFEHLIVRKTTVLSRVEPGAKTPILKSHREIGISGKKKIYGKEAFDLYQTYGFPIELTKELAEENNFVVDEEEFQKELQKHQKLSRAGAEQKFKGGLADHSEQTTKYHTATHLLLAALRQVLGEHVYQKGSNITAERLRFDFSHSQKLTPEEIKSAEDLVNQKIQEDLSVVCEEMSFEEAKGKNAMGVFEHKYSERVKVYTIGANEDVFSREICGGPHISKTGQLGRFKILKEESSSAGVRRIKAMLE